MTDTNNIVISSRVRLARNQRGLPFASAVLDERTYGVAKAVYEAVGRQSKFSLIRLSSLGDLEIGLLKEQHIISPDLIKNRTFGSVVVSENLGCSIMIGEEDHIRIQAMEKGFGLEAAYRAADGIDNKIAAAVSYCFESQLGYLTSCPTNLGTGMRASVMVFLPALAIISKGNIAGKIGTPNITVRGIYGEGTDADGYMFQVSNSRTLGVTEQEIVAIVNNTVTHLMSLEMQARELLLRRDAVGVRDQIMRAYGVLTNAYTLSAKEFMQLIALVKMGVGFGYINISDLDRLERLIIEAQPAHISSNCSKEPTPEERDMFRAHFVANVLRKLVG